jgi:hypothetical protein
MNMKKLPLLAILLIVVIGIIVISNQLSNKKPTEDTLAFFPQFSEESCGSLKVTTASETTVLLHKDGKWVVSGSTETAVVGNPLSQSVAPSKTQEYPADSTAIQMALDKIKAMKKEDLISQNKDKQIEYEVDTTKGIRLDVYSDKGTLKGTVYIGKNGSDWSSNFIRAKGSNDVYLVSGSVKYAFFTEKTRWKNKSIVKFDRAFAKGIDLVKKDTVIQLVYEPKHAVDTTKKACWTIVAPVKDTAKTTVMDQLLGNLSNLNALDFEDNSTLSDDSMGLAKPYLTISIALTNGDKKIVSIGKEKGSTSRRWAKTPDKNAVFLVDVNTVKDFDKSVNALRGIEEKKPAVPVKKPGKK